MLLKNVDYQHLSPRQAAQLVINDGDQSLLAIAARLMREIPVDRARMHGAAKHGANCLTLSFDETVALPKRREIDLVALDDALNALGALEKPQIGGIGPKSLVRVGDYTSMWIVSGWPTIRDSHAFPLLHRSSVSNAIQAGSDTSQLVFINWL